MIPRYNKRRVPQLNTTSTADISFILLVFFLVMTSMDVDKGLVRMLPPIDNDDKQEVIDVEKSNVLTVRLTPDDNIFLDGKPCEISHLRKRVAAFVGQSADSRDRVIMLCIDRHASYDVYFNVQNEIVAVYNVLRDRYARKTFGRAYALCTPEERDKVRAAYPQKIIETSTDGEEGAAR